MLADHKDMQSRLSAGENPCIAPDEAVIAALAPPDLETWTIMATQHSHFIGGPPYTEHHCQPSLSPAIRHLFFYPANTKDGQDLLRRCITTRCLPDISNDPGLASLRTFLEQPYVTEAPVWKELFGGQPPEEDGISHVLLGSSPDSRVLRIPQFQDQERIPPGREANSALVHPWKAHDSPATGDTTRQPETGTPGAKNSHQQEDSHTFPEIAE